MDYISKILSKVKLNGLKMIVASKYICETIAPNISTDCTFVSLSC